MTKIAIVYGGITGFVIICSIILGIVLGAHQVWLGFLIMIVAFSAIYFAVRQYRDQALGGVIKFGTAALLGLGIVAVASIVYVIVWETYLYATDYAFMQTYTESMLNEAKAKGITGPEWDAVVAETTRMKSLYASPLTRMPLTLMEVFPMGVLIDLISAAALRTRKA